MNKDEINFKILKFLTEKHFSGQPMHYFQVDEVIEGAKLKEKDRKTIEGQLLYLYNKKFVARQRQLGIAYPIGVYINALGIDEFTRLEKENQPKKPEKKSVHFFSTSKLSFTKIVEITSIIGFGLLILGLFGFGVIDPLIFFCQSGISQNTYTDCELGFQISKSNERWDFDTDLKTVKTVRTGYSPDEYYVGGIYVSTVDRDHVLIAVYDDDRLLKQSLNDWIDDLEKIAQFYNATTIKKEISLDEDWAMYAAKFSDADGQGYGEQIIRIENNKIYLIQSMGPDLDVRTEKQSKEFDYIFDSFKTFRTIQEILFVS